MDLPSHYRFRFDRDGRLLSAGPYLGGDVDPFDTRVTVPEAESEAREVIVPRAHPALAEDYARRLVEEQQGFGGEGGDGDAR